VRITPFGLPVDPEVYCRNAMSSGVRATGASVPPLSAAPNFAYEICATKLDERDLEGLDLSSWRWAFNGAEPVSPETMERFAARFAPYGLDPR